MIGSIGAKARDAKSGAYSGSRAKDATTKEARADFLHLERNWLKLAHSYEAIAVEFGSGLR
jgi:hypothetical protein